MATASFADWTKTPAEVQIDYIKSLLEDGITDSDSDVRILSARQLLYIAEGMFSPLPASTSARSPNATQKLTPVPLPPAGTFQHSTSPEHHMHLIMTNVALLRRAGTLEAVWEGVKGTMLRWEGVSQLVDADAPVAEGEMDHEERNEVLEEVNKELAVYLAILYFMMEVNRGDEEWGDELSKSTAGEGVRRHLAGARGRRRRQGCAWRLTSPCQWPRSETGAADADRAAQLRGRLAGEELEELPG